MRLRPKIAGKGKKGRCFNQNFCHFVMCGGLVFTSKRASLLKNLDLNFDSFESKMYLHLARPEMPGLSFLGLAVYLITFVA